MPRMKLRLASWSTILALGLAVAAPACGGPAATSAPAAPAPAPEPDPYGVVVLDPGAEPRAPRRVQVPVGTRRAVAHAMEFSAEGAPPTAMRTSWTLEVTSAEPPTMTVAMSVDDGPLAGARGQWTIDERGHLSPPTDGDGARMVLQQSMVEHLIPTLPREAIGPGARWTTPALMSPGVGEAGLPGTITWELTAADGARVTLAGALEVPETTTPFQDQTMHMSSTGTLAVQLDLATLEGEVSLDMALAIRVGDGEQAQRMASTARVTATLR
jgi:hypothetical protein